MPISYKDGEFTEAVKGFLKSARNAVLVILVFFIICACLGAIIVWISK